MNDAFMTDVGTDTASTITARYYKGLGNHKDNLVVKQVGKDGSSNRDNPNQYRVYETDGLSPCLNSMNGGGREPHIPVSINRNGIGGGAEHRTNSDGERLQRDRESRYDCSFGIDKSENGQPRKQANTLTAREDRGVSRQKQTGTAVAIKIKVENE